MAPAPNTLELELLIYAIAVLIFVGSFLAILVSAIFGLSLARLLYVGRCWCVRKIHQPHSLDRTGMMNAFGRIVPRH